MKALSEQRDKIQSRINEMNRRLFFFGSLASAGLLGCGSGSKPEIFDTLYEFTVDIGTYNHRNVARFIRNDGTVVSASYFGDDSGMESRPYLWETADFGQGSTRRIDAASLLSFGYDRLGDRYVSTEGNRVRILDRHLSIISDRPITPLGDDGNVSSEFVLDGDSLLSTPIAGAVKPDRAYRIGFDGVIRNTYSLPDGFQANPFLVRGKEGNLYIGSSQKEITNLGPDGTSFEPTGLRSIAYLIFDSKGFAYGSDSKKIYKLDLSTRKIVAELSMPDEYSYFSSSLSYRIALDAQDRLYVPVAPRGQRVLVLSTG